MNTPKSMDIRIETVTVHGVTATIVKLFNGDWWVRFDDSHGATIGTSLRNLPTLDAARTHALRTLFTRQFEL